MSRSGWLAGPLAALLLTQGTVSGAAEPRFRFEIQEPFRLGSKGFNGGVVIMRGISSFTPSSSILEVWVDGQCFGMVSAHVSVSELSPERSEALFQRDGDGRLNMLGITVAGDPTGTTYRFR
jgi:hypothetical protein